MIPKIIHYCWLSKDKKPETIRKCIASWGRYFPEYEIRLWDMGSFDFDSVPFTKEALAAKKWAFVSDYIRLHALYNYGGIYLDFDVQAFGPIDELLENRFFTGLEMRDKEHTDIYLEGAIMGAEKGHPFVGESLELFNKRRFLLEDGSYDMTPIPTVLSEIMERKYAWVRKDETTHLEDGITIYATDTIANSNCPVKPGVKLYHLNNRSWIPTTRTARLLRWLKRKLC